MSKPKNVAKATKVTIDADLLIESISAVANYYKLHLNGESKVSASELLGFVFERIVCSNDRDAALMDFFKYVNLKDSRGEPLNDNELQRIVKEINTRR